ncbi:FtsX-like permease family protein [Brachybacterium sp.]|uniref:FtsX-like permease family protein n=1 Tax=Brachybacterium sp. TaxID=1891286 RepID=UPI002ED595C1
MILRTALLSALRRPRQALLIGIAVVAATAFAATALLLATNGRTALEAFGITTPEAADAVIVPRGDVDAEEVHRTAETLRALPGTEQVVVESLGDAEVQIGGTTSTWKLSSDPGSGPLSAVPELTSGSAPEPGEVVLGESTAARTGASVGDVMIVDGRELTVAGIGPVHEFGRDAALVREEDAAALGDVMIPVQIFVTGDVALTDLEALAPHSVISSGEEKRDAEARTVTDTLVGVIGGLVLFVALAMLAAVVIVSSTFRILLVRRATELSLLRCIGASRAQVRRLVLVEAACIGVIGGVLGVGIGTGIGAVMIAIARDAGLLTAPFSAPVTGLIGCVALAATASLAAAVPAARTAGQASPVEALGSSRATEARPVRRGPRLMLAAALVLTAAAAAGLGVLVSSEQEFLGLALAALSGTLVFLALVLLGPLLVSIAAAMLRPLASRSPAMSLAVANTRRASRRTAAMTTVLTLGVGLTAALTVGVSGATQDARDGVARNFPAPAIIPTDLVEDPDALVAQLDEHPAVDARIEDLDILIDATPGTSDDELRSAVLGTIDPGTDVFWAADVQSGIDQMILIGQAVGGAMIGVTLLVALIGVMVTLSLSVTERRQEISLLRALGLSRAVARRAIGAEAALAAAVGASTGVGVGGLFGILALHILGMAVGVPPLGTLAVLFLAVIAAAIAAAAIPMWNAGRVPPALGLAA